MGQSRGEGASGGHRSLTAGGIWWGPGVCRERTRGRTWGAGVAGLLWPAGGFGGRGRRLAAAAAAGVADRRRFRSAGPVCGAWMGISRPRHRAGGGGTRGRGRRLIESPPNAKRKHTDISPYCINLEAFENKSSLQIEVRSSPHHVAGEVDPDRYSRLAQPYTLMLPYCSSHAAICTLCHRVTFSFIV